MCGASAGLKRHEILFLRAKSTSFLLSILLTASFSSLLAPRKFGPLSLYIIEGEPRSAASLWIAIIAELAYSVWARSTLPESSSRLGVFPPFFSASTDFHVHRPEVIDPAVVKRLPTAIGTTHGERAHQRVRRLPTV